MANLFILTVITPDKIVYQGKAVSLIAPAALGYLGVLANHAPLAANLTKGKIIIKEESGNTVNFYSAEKGFLRVFRNNVTLLLDRVGPG